MRKTILTTTLAALLVLSATGMAGSSSNPEIEDDRGDLSAQYLLDPALTGPAQEEAPELPSELENISQEQQEKLAHSADLVAAWIDGETAKSFLVHVQVAELYDHDNVSSPLVDVVTHFTIKSDTYRSVTTLSFPPDGGNLQADHTLYRGSQKLADLAGSLDNSTETITLLVPKAQVRDPGFGDQLTEFYVTSHFPGQEAELDRAPNRAGQDADGFDVLDPSLSGEATYGAPYDFGQYEGSVPADLDVTVSPGNVLIEAGEAGKVVVRIENDAAVEDTVQLATGVRPDGWDVRLEHTKLTLQPGQSRLVTVYLTPPSDEEGQEILTVRVLSSLGADSQWPFSAQVTQPEASDPDPEPEPAPEPTPTPTDQPASSQDDAEEEGIQETPWVSPLSLIGAAGTLAFAARRRRG